MRIAVSIKQVADVALPLKLAPSTSTLAEEGFCYFVNPADSHAAEEAVRIKDARPGTEVVLLSLGPPRVEGALRSCLAMGADRALHLWDSAFANSDSLVRAKILARAIAGLNADLVLCGSRSEDEAQGVIPGMLAEFLGLPYVSAVADLKVSTDATSLRLQRKLQHGNREVVECPLPALLAIEPGINRPRYASVRDVMRALRHPIERMGMSDLGLTCGEVGTSASPIKLVKLAPARPRPKKIFTVDSNLSPEERAKLLLSGGVQEKKGGLWEGSPQEMAQRLVEFLTKGGFLSS